MKQIRDIENSKKMAYINSPISITLNISGLNNPIKRQRL